MDVLGSKTRELIRRPEVRAAVEKVIERSERRRPDDPTAVEETVTVEGSNETIVVRVEIPR